MKRRIRVSRGKRLRYGLIIGAGVSLLLGMIWAGGWFETLRLRLNNVYYVDKPVSDDIVIVAIDDPSIATYGRISGWSRTIYADLVDQLSADRARVVVFDVLFSESSENPADDEAFAEALLNARRGPNRTRVVMTISGENQRATAPTGTIVFQDFLTPTPILAETGVMFGFVNILPEADSTIRWQPLRAGSEQNPEVQYSLSAAAYLSYLRIPADSVSQVVSADETILTLAQREVPIDEQGRTLINYFGRPESGNTFTVVSLADVVAGKVPSATFDDKIVLVGALNATGVTDIYAVPIGFSGEQMAGVGIHANMLEAFLQDNFISQQSPLSQGVTLILVALLTSILYMQLRWRWILGVMLGLAVLWFFAAFQYYNGVLQLVSIDISNQQLNLFDPLLAIIIPAPLALAMNVYLETERRQWAEQLLNSAMLAASKEQRLEDLLVAVTQDAATLVPNQQVEIWLWDSVLEKLHLAQSLVAGTPPNVLPMQVYSAKTSIITAGKGGFPLLWQEEAIGVLVITPHKTLNATQRQILELFAWQTASIIANAKLYKEATDLSELKTRMIRMASHDLKNPIGAIMGYTEILLEEQTDMPFLSAEQERFVNAVMTSANQMQIIVKDILNLERVKSGRLEMQECELADLVGACVRQYTTQAEEKGQQLTASIPERFPLVIGDYGQLREAISNLVGNAIKYTPDGGQISIELKEAGHKATIRVSDNGHGIPLEAQDRLFQEFYRVRTAETVGISGTGLGLSLVKSVITAHKGKVMVQSEVGKGSTFTIELPLPETNPRL